MQKFDTPAPISAVLDIPAGRIQFIAADRADTTVEVLPAERLQGPRREGGGADHGRIRRRRPADRVLGEEPVPRPLRIHRGDGPAARRFPGRGQGGQRRVPRRRTARRRRLRQARTASIKLDEAASARLTTVDGDVSVGRLGGPAEISTARGDIQIAEAVRGTVVLRTQAGDDLGRRRRRSLGLPWTPAPPTAASATRLKNDGTADLNIHATTAHGDITARSL